MIILNKKTETSKIKKQFMKEKSEYCDYGRWNVAEIKIFIILFLSKTNIFAFNQSAFVFSHIFILLFEKYLQLIKIYLHVNW